MRSIPKQILCDALRFLGYELHRARRTPPFVEVPLIDVFDLVLRDYLTRNPPPIFLQVGAHDGGTEDPAVHRMRRYGLRGLLVEPQPIAFKRLVEHYDGESKLAFENSLLGPSDGQAKFYKVREEPGLPSNLLQSASLD